MRWIDVDMIVESLCEEYPDLDPEVLLFTEIRKHVLTLEGFIGDPDACNERILEAIQQRWIEDFKS